VNAVLKAQAAKEMAARERQAAELRPVSKEIIVETDAKGNTMTSENIILFQNTKWC
jgi:hypothetical protein